MCKKYDINTTKNAKPLRKVELIETLSNKLTKKISFSDKVEILDHPQNNNNRFDRFGAAVAWHFTNFFKDPYDPNNSFGYPISANSGQPSKDGDGTFVFEDKTLPGVKLTTMCGGKIYQDTVTNN